MSPFRWLLPDSPDLIGALRSQTEATLDGVEALADWARGDPGAATRIRAAEHRGDERKRDLVEQLRAAFITPLEPEDLFALSRGIDWILNYARDLVNESEAMRRPPDQGIAEMSELIGDAIRHIDAALASIVDEPDRASEAADAALASERQLQRVYYNGMARLLEVDEPRERIALRELYRRCSRIGDEVIDVAERIVYSVVKES